MREGGITAVLGMGNLILSDDGLGVHALRLLEQDPRLPGDVVLVDAGTVGVELLGYVDGAERLVVLDAVDVGAPPGTLIRLRGGELRDCPGAGSVHDIGLIDLLSALRLMDRAPREVVVLGIQPASTEPGLTLSPAVEAALPRLVDAAIGELQSQGWVARV